MHPFGGGKWKTTLQAYFTTIMLMIILTQLIRLRLIACWVSGPTCCARLNSMVHHKLNAKKRVGMLLQISFCNHAFATDIQTCTKHLQERNNRDLWQACLLSYRTAWQTMWLIIQLMHPQVYTSFLAKYPMIFCNMVLRQ